jgi:hypothetical protein
MGQKHSDMGLGIDRSTILQEGMNHSNTFFTNKPLPKRLIALPTSQNRNVCEEEYLTESLEYNTTDKMEWMISFLELER